MIDLSTTEPIFYLHIGQSKTGTTAIQSFMDTNRRKLFEQGILYPNMDAPSYLDDHCLNHAEFFVKGRENKEIVLPELEKLFCFCREHNVRKLVMSIEWFPFKWWADLMGIAVQQIACRYKILLYLKRQDYWIEGAWKQWGHKREEYNTIRDYYRDVNLDWLRRLEAWLVHFEKENFELYPFEKTSIGEDVVLHFLNRLGIDSKEDFEIPVFNEENFNFGWSPVILEILKSSNHLLNSLHDNKLLIYFSDMLSDHYKKKDPFQSYGLLSPMERIEILKKYEKSNQQIAQLFFGTERESLFQEPWPDPDLPWHPPESLTLESVVPVFIELLYKQYIETVALRNQLMEINGELQRLKYQMAEKPKEAENHSTSWMPMDCKRILHQEKYRHQLIWEGENEDGCIVQSQGNDPYFILPFLRRHIFKKSLRIILTVPEATGVRIYYKKYFFDKYHERNSVEQQALSGRNVLIFKSPGRLLMGDLRIDPGTVPGSYIIHSIEIGD